MPLGGGHGLLGEVERHDVMVGVPLDAVDHVAAHLAEADEADLHWHCLPKEGCLADGTDSAHACARSCGRGSAPGCSAVPAGVPCAVEVAVALMPRSVR